jgi:uncharacterized integral membrane protein (TIGR00697 family)
MAIAMMYNSIFFVLHMCGIMGFSLVALRFGAAALTSLICVQVILANLFITKQIILLGLHATPTDAYTVGSVLCINMLQEYFGRSSAQRALYISFILLLFYVGASQLQLWYIPAAADSMHVHFDAVLSFMPRIAIASLCVYGLVTYLDVALYHLFKTLMQNRYLLLRNAFSVIICQFLDTVLFSFLGLYGIVDHLWHVIFVSYVVKLLALLVALPLVAVSKRLV